MHVTDKLVIPVSDDIRVTPEEIERHCAAAGWIITNLQPAPDGTTLTAAGQVMRNGDYGMNFWFADVVATELENYYDDAPPIDYPFDLIDPKVDSFFSKMSEKWKSADKSDKTIPIWKPEDEEPGSE